MGINGALLFLDFAQLERHIGRHYFSFLPSCALSDAPSRGRVVGVVRRC